MDMWIFFFSTAGECKLTMHSAEVLFSDWLFLVHYLAEKSTGIGKCKLTLHSAEFLSDLLFLFIIWLKKSTGMGECKLTLH
jgi:hypothetical protein